MLLRVSTLVLVVLGVGCVTGEVDEPKTGDVQQDIQLCDGWLCGTNSPEIAEFGFWELNLPPVLGTPGLANNVGMQVLDFVQGAIHYLPRVSKGRLTAVRDADTLSGGALAGGWLRLKNGSRTFKVRVLEVGSVDSWAQPPLSPGIALESYKLDWTELVNGQWGRFSDVCKNPPSRDNGDALTMTGTYAYHTLLFEGDRIDPIMKKLDMGIDTSWFNLGCAGSALAKMALTGHTQAALEAGTFTTTLSERQTMLKMLAADYCGDGMPFTVPGQPLNWQDDRDTMQLIAPPLQLVLESRWTAMGAACLEMPRVDAHPTVLSNQELGVDVYDQVQSHCPLKMPPPCSDKSLAIDGYHLLSATPL
jgi:hypothetical protein